MKAGEYLNFYENDIVKIHLTIQIRTHEWREIQKHKQFKNFKECEVYLREKLREQQNELIKQLMKGVK